MNKSKQQTNNNKTPCSRCIPSVAKWFLDSFQNAINQMNYQNSGDCADIFDEINKNIKNIKNCLNVLDERKGLSGEHKIDFKTNKSSGTDYLLVSSFYFSVIIKVHCTLMT